MPLFHWTVSLADINHVRAMVLLSLAYQSLRHRKLTSALTLGSIALSVALLIGV